MSATGHNHEFSPTPMPDGKHHCTRVIGCTAAITVEQYNESADPGGGTGHTWGRYTLLVATCANGPTATEVDDTIAEGLRRNVRELTLTIYVDLYCQRCDTEIAALEPDDVALADVVSVIAAHEPTCRPAKSWAGDA